MSRMAKPVILGALGLTALTLGLQYVQHVREDRLMRSDLRVEHKTEFAAPTNYDNDGGGIGSSATHPSNSLASSGAHVFGQSGSAAAVQAMDSRLGKLERALSWLEARPAGAPLPALPAVTTPASLPEGLGDATSPVGSSLVGQASLHVPPPGAVAPSAPTISHQPLTPPALFPDTEKKKRPKVDTSSSHSKLHARNRDTKKQEEKQQKHDAKVERRRQAAQLDPLPSSSNGQAGYGETALTSLAPAIDMASGMVTDAPFLLQRLLQVVKVTDVTDYPKWYFGDKGARGYFEDGPWATTADVNITNDNYCAKARGKDGPWRALSKLKPSYGRVALVATVSRCSICDFLSPWKDYGLPSRGGLHPGGVVLIGGGNENWGMFSEYVENRSVAWGAFTGKLKSCGKTMADFQAFMNDPRLLLWVTNQHQAIGAVHPKVLSLPLGMKNNPSRIYNDGMKKHRATKKKKLLIINNSGWKHRTAVNALVASRFPELAKVGNAYAVGRDAGKAQDYYEQLAEAKFVLCPSGMGYDTYRHWEVLLMGSIPVFESSPGFDKTFAKLPVVIVASYADVTPALLEAKYAEFARRADLSPDDPNGFDFQRLRKQYWMDLIFGAADTGSSAQVLANHPPDRGLF